MIQFENEVLKTLRLPSIPLKEWDGKKSFKYGVAVLGMRYGGEAYAIASYDANVDARPVIVKVFSLEQFTDLRKILVVPDYMDDNVDKFDVDEESVEAARLLAEEARELEASDNDAMFEEHSNDDKEEEDSYYFDNIHNDEEAAAFIRTYNKRHGIAGRVPTTHDALVMRLYAIYNDGRERKKRKNNK